jgi:hypothetical protein
LLQLIGADGLGIIVLVPPAEGEGGRVVVFLVKEGGVPFTLRGCRFSRSRVCLLIELYPMVGLNLDHMHWGTAVVDGAKESPHDVRALLAIHVSEVFCSTPRGESLDGVH